MADTETAFDRGLEAYSRGDFKTARTALASALVIQPNFADLLRCYADACLDQGAQEEAWDALRHPVIREPANMAVRNGWRGWSSRHGGWTRTG